jgi:hypothetical protein
VSLKGVHIIFIVLAILGSIFFGIWALKDFQTTENVMMFFVSVSAFLFAAGLAVYAAIFFHKVKP